MRAATRSRSTCSCRRTRTSARSRPHRRLRPLPSLWLIVPAHGRYPVSRVAFAGLRWALDQLAAHNIEGHAVVIADDANLDIAREHGLDTLNRPNRPLGRKWNDGYEHAARNGADYLVPCGSDDWIHPDFLAALPAKGQIGSARYDTIVHRGEQIGHFLIDYSGGPGIRIMRRDMLRAVDYRPADDRRDRVIDGSVMDKLRRAGVTPEYVYAEDPLSFVQFETGEQITSWAGMVHRFRSHRVFDDPWAVLERRYPAGLVALAKTLYT